MHEGGCVSFRRLVVGFTFLAIFAMAVRVSIDTDTWWHLRAGSLIVEEGKILLTDPFSFTRFGQSWKYPGWLAQGLLYKVYEILGFAGLNILTAVFVIIAFVFIWRVLEGPVLFRSAVMLLTGTVAGVYWSARPQIISFALAGVFLWVLHEFVRDRRAILWILPPLMVLWANVHGGFAIGFMFIIGYLLGEIIDVVVEVMRRKLSISEAWQKKRSKFIGLVGVGLACAVAVCLNPHGPETLLYPFKTIAVGVLRDHIQEWQTPNFHHIEVQPFLWMVMLILISMALSRLRVYGVELIMVVGFTYLSLLAGRNIALFAMVGAPVLARHGAAALEPFLQGRDKGRQVPENLARVLNVVLFLLLTIAVIAKMVAPLDQQVIREAIAEQVPVDAISNIKERQPPGPLFNAYNWGGYILWELYPQYQTFVDGRTDLFDDEILRQYLKVWTAAPGWEQVLDDWDIQTVLIENGAPLARELQHIGWEKMYEDEMAIVYSLNPMP
jgi:hypothetical protein